MSRKKHIRKVALTTMAASAAVVSIAPVASAAETKEFKDVPKGSSHYDGVQWAVAEGIVKGYEDGTFGVGKNLTRSHAAVMFVKARGLKELPASEVTKYFNDVNEKTPYAGYIAAAAKAGIFKGDAKKNFNINNPLTREQMATTLVQAFGLKSDGKHVDVNLKNVAPSHQANVQIIADLGITNQLKDFRPAQAVQRGQFATFLKLTNDVINAPAAEAAVESVKAINATEVQVTFTEAVDKLDAEKAANTSIQNVTISSRTLSTDGKTLTLVANAPIDVKNAAVVVEPIITKADKLVKTEKFVSLLTYKDEVAPTITSVEAKSNGTTATSLTVKASEPIKTGALVKVNGAYASIDFNGSDTATVSGLSLETGKTHTIELINLEDLAGNKTVSTSANFTVNVDSASPTATLTAQGDKEILVTFNKKMNVAKTEAALGNGVVKSESLDNIASGNAKVVTDSNDTQFLIPVTAVDIFKNKDSRTFNVVLSNSIEDAIGNKVEASTQKVTLTKDTVKPVATGYNVVKDIDGKVTKIEVNFSEGLAANGNPAEPTIVDENGVAISAGSFLGGITADAITAGDKKVTYTATTPAKVTGKYAFSFGSELVSDLAETANKSSAFNFTIDFGKGETVDTFELPTGTLPSATNNVITVTFPEAVKGGAVANSATDTSNYTLAGKPLPQGTNITLNPAQTVATINLPAESIEKNDPAAIFTVANIKNTAGTKTVKSYSGTLAVEDNVKPVLTSANFTADNHLVIGFSEKLATNPVIGDFVFKVNNQDVVASGTNTLTVTPGTGSDAGKYLVNFEDLVIQGSAATNGVDGVAGTIDDVPATPTFVDLNNNGTFESTDIKIGDGPVADFKFSTSSVIDNVNVSTLKTGDSTAKDASNNFLKNDVTVKAK